MHFHRLLALVGVLIGVIGLFFTALSTAGEGAMEQLSAIFAEQGVEFPDGIPTIWGGLDTWAQWVLVILIIVVMVLALRPVISETYDTISASATSVIGFALLVYAIIKYFEAGDDAETLEEGFATAVQLGVPGVEAWSVTPSIGFFVLMLGTVVVLAAGILSLISSNEAAE